MSKAPKTKKSAAPPTPRGPLQYDLLVPFVYKHDMEGSKREYVCKGFTIERPKGRKASRVFALLSKMQPLADGGEIPGDLADTVIDFVGDFGQVTGDPDWPALEAAELLDTADIMELANKLLANFMSAPNT